MPSTYSITQADLETRLDLVRLIELTDDEAAPTGAVDLVVIDRVIVRAETEFEQYAGKLYALPVIPLPAGAKEKLIDLAAYYLLTRKPELLSDESSQGNYWIRLRKELLAWLEAVAAGAVVLPGVSTAPLASARGEAEVVADTPRFTRDSMRYF